MISKLINCFHSHTKFKVLNEVEVSHRGAGRRIIPIFCLGQWRFDHARVHTFLQQQSWSAYGCPSPVYQECLVRSLVYINLGVYGHTAVASPWNPACVLFSFLLNYSKLNSKCLLSRAECGVNMSLIPELKAEAGEPHVQDQTRVTFWAFSQQQ